MRPARRITLLVTLVAVFACDSPERSVTAPAPTGQTVQDQTGSTTHNPRSLSRLTGGELASFSRGSAVFNRVFTPQTGLGPLFNANSCAACHVGAGAGVQIETHGTVFHADGTCDQLDSVGGQVFQSFATPQLTAATGLTSEPIPSYAQIGHRSTPQLFGRGLLESISDADIRAQAVLEKRDDPKAAGRVAVLANGAIGRFGRKDNASTLLDFNTDAFLYEIGITTPTEDSVDGPIGPFPVPPGVDLAHDPELSLADLNATTDFVRYLAPPSVGRAEADDEMSFRGLGCATCHVPSMQTGYNSVGALSHQTVRAYTDLLLHDMGPGLADICLGVARPREFRTEPLMGLGTRTVFLHDGRATTIDQAILAHGGQAAAAQRRYTALSWKARDALLRYLRTL